MLRRPRCYLQEKRGRWSIIRNGDRAYPLVRETGEILVEEGAVEPTAHQGRRWFKITQHGHIRFQARVW